MTKHMFWIVPVMILGAINDLSHEHAQAAYTPPPVATATPAPVYAVAPPVYYGDEAAPDEGEACDDYCREDQAEALMASGMSEDEAADELGGHW
jgi:hypothetical protein